MALVLSWTKALTSAVMHPSLEGNPTLILAIFYRVVNSFMRILLWYSFLIVSFGLGFYIMLHKGQGFHFPGFSPSHYTFEQR